jgi:hypothetical protein
LSPFGSKSLTKKIVCCPCGDNFIICKTEAVHYETVAD